MLWNANLGLNVWLVLLFRLLLASCKRLPPIYWNTTNPFFHSTEHNYVDVRIRDLVDLVCPNREPSVRDNDPSALVSYFEIHQVSKSGFDSCTKTPDSKIVGICASPFNHQIVSLSIRRYTPKPKGLEFSPGLTYYFIATSNQTTASFPLNSLCKLRNMKMRLNVFSSHHRHHNNHHPHGTGGSPQGGNVLPPIVNGNNHKNNNNNNNHEMIVVPPSRSSSFPMVSRERGDRERYENVDQDGDQGGMGSPSQSSTTPRDEVIAPPIILLLENQAEMDTFHDHQHAAYIVAEQYWPKKIGTNLTASWLPGFLSLCWTILLLNQFTGVVLS